MRMIRNLLSSIALFAILSMTFAYSNEPRPKMRSPDDNMLQQTESAIRRVRAPTVIDETDSKSEPKTLFSELPLAGRRGNEAPSGNKYGRYCEPGFIRAGFSNCVGRFAKSNPDAYHQVGYVGGGTLFGGSCRRVDEGTFGMDYSGYWFSRKTWLKWSHGERHQGGEGRYETEGPRLLPE